MKTNLFNLSRSLFTAGLACLAMATAPAQTSSNLSIQLYAGLTITNAAGSTCSVEYTTDLSQPNHWAALTNLTLPASPYLYIDTTAPASASRRFYRVSTPSAPSATNPNPAKLVSISPGTFMMGEAPDAVQVTLTRGYYIAKNLVTQSEYQEVMRATPSESGISDACPVEMVSWPEATNYCALLTTNEQAAGRLPADWAYRLPTEAEWEYACRAGTTTRFSFGDDPGGTNIQDYAWFTGNSGATTKPVGTKRSNPWGLYDMHGNVHQWCLECWAALKAGIDPVGPLTGGDHVWRGGSFNSPFSDCTSTYRSEENTKQSNIGFRVVAARVQP